ncbi:MAG TPA: hypothetical protein VGH43_03080 [Jatrophihabitans sp.]|jgi:hypothetical protein
MTTTLEVVAHRMFIRNVADYAEPALAELAWIDPDIRSFWVQQAQDVRADLVDLADLDAEGRDNGDHATLSRGPGRGAHPRSSRPAGPRSHHT